MASILDGRNKRLKIGKTTKRTIPIPVLPPRIPTPMPALPKKRYDNDDLSISYRNETV
jgi:hypothetical protein